MRQKGKWSVSCSPNEPFRAGQRREVNLSSIEGKHLFDFTTHNTLQFFHILGLNSNFLLTVDPDDWDSNERYQQGKRCAESLRVVNDSAERAIKLIKDFNSSLARNEEQKQFLLQVVSNHCCMFPVAKKSCLAKNTKNQ